MRLTLVFARHGESEARLRPLRFGSCFAAALSDPFRYAILLRSRTSPNIRVGAFATMLLTHSPAFARFDEILYLVENASDLTLPDFVRCPRAAALPASLADRRLHPVVAFAGMQLTLWQTLPQQGQSFREANWGSKTYGTNRRAPGARAVLRAWLLVCPGCPKLLLRPL
jgi:hypothetical protein